MSSVLLLLAVTGLYAGYNLLIKVSSGHVPAAATSTVLATICLQIAALAASLLFTAFLLLRGGQQLQLTAPAYAWAAAAGLCIGAAEIGYFYLFGGLGGLRPMAANVAIPAIVSGTIVLTAAASLLLFRETLAWPQVLGLGLVVAGLLLTFLGRGA
jgi:drug/metabolite transporter (DMT)-like permease